jgi:DNA polymerase-3 subunit delta'
LGKTLKPLISAKEADEIVRRLSFKSFEAEYKTMIIWLPEAMNDEAANKILKILEEPWERTLFILVSERPDRLLPTIISRTQEVVVPRLQDSELMPLAEGLEPLQGANMARLAAGDVVEMRRLVSGEEDGRRAESFERFCALMRLSYNDKHLELIEWADEVAAQPNDAQQALLNHSARLLRESYMLHAGLGQISYLWGEEAQFCQKFAPFIGNENIEQIIEQIELARRQISQNGNAKIVFTHFALAVSKMIRRLK